MTFTELLQEFLGYLQAGDTGTAEIVMGQRRVIDYVLDHFKRLSQDGFKL